VDAGGDPNGVRTVGVLGIGTMGAGIVQLAAQTGHRVVACDLSVDALEKAQLYVHDGLSRFVGRGAFSEEEAEEHYDVAPLFGPTTCCGWTFTPERCRGPSLASRALLYAAR
jgi:threonine dehydrogenase-like Zn-dependent dehydrogenase